MKYFLDAEFMEDGKTIDLLSLALVAEAGAEFYAVNSEADLSKANPWVRENVLPHLHNELTNPHVTARLGNRNEIHGAVLRFIANTAGAAKPRFWGYYADYDWVAFCQLFGTMMDLPKGFPMYCRDIKQLCDMLGNPELPAQRTIEHHALLDARWNKVAFDYLMNRAGSMIVYSVDQQPKESWNLSYMLNER